MTPVSAHSYACRSFILLTALLHLCYSLFRKRWHVISASCSKSMGVSGTSDGFPYQAFDPSRIPDIDTEFISDSDLKDFAKALNAPESAPLVALNDWRPVRQRVRSKKTSRKKSKRTKDETREGFVYNILKWPFLLIILGWIVILSTLYLITRFYIWAYERLITWRGQRQKLRRTLRSKTNFGEWKIAAEALDTFLGNDNWKADDDYSYYDFQTVSKVKDQLAAVRKEAAMQDSRSPDAITRLKLLVEASVKNNAFGVENPRLYSETYYGTKNLAQEFIEELHASLSLLLKSPHLNQAEKGLFCKQLHTNLGRSKSLPRFSHLNTTMKIIGYSL